MLHLHRKKISSVLLPIGLLFLSISTVVSSATAQSWGRELNLPNHEEKPYYFGLSLGTTFSRFNTNHHSQFLAQDSIYVGEPLNSGGLLLGLLATVRLSKRLELRFNPQLMIMERNLFYQLKHPDLDGQTELTKTISSTITSFPLQLKFHSDRIGNFRAYMLGGIKFNNDLASNAGKNRAEDLIKIKKYDWGPELGIGFNFFFPSFILSPEIKISHGATNIHSRDPNLKFSNIFDKISSRMVVFSIHIGG